MNYSICCSLGFNEPGRQFNPDPLCTDFFWEGGKENALEERTYREDRRLIKEGRREGRMEAVSGCGCYRYLA